MRKVKMKKLKPRKKKVPRRSPTMAEQQLFDELREAIHKLGLILRVEKGNFKGGICVVEGEKRFVFINKKFSVEQQLITLGRAVKELGAETVYLSPRTREFLEQLPDEPLEVISAVNNAP